MNDEEVLELFDSCSNWGRWGPDDTIGTANYITPASRVRAVTSEVEWVSSNRRLSRENSNRKQGGRSQTLLSELPVFLVGHAVGSGAGAPRDSLESLR